MIAAALLFPVMRFKEAGLEKRAKEPHRFYFTISFFWITLPYDPVSMNFHVMMYGAVFLFLSSLFLERGQPLHVTTNAVITLVYLGAFGSTLA